MKKDTLIQKIKKCNLSKEEKEELITLLNKSDNDGFLKAFFAIIRFTEMLDGPLAEMLNDIIELII